MKVKLATRLGFCFGVKRALELTEHALATDGGLYVLGELIHNRAVVDKLAAGGLHQVPTVADIPSGRLVVRAHGVTQDIYRQAAKRGIELIDATCPFVQKAQETAAMLVRQGYLVLLVGDRDHAEVRGIVSAAAGPVQVVSSIDELSDLPTAARIGLLFQTTKRPEAVRQFTEALLPHCHELRVFNTICRATTDRQQAVRELAPTVDAMVIVGDPGSANTNRLTAIAAEHNERTVQVEHVAQLERSFFEGCSTVGLSAGASTPNWLIDEVRSFLEQL